LNDKLQQLRAAYAEKLPAKGNEILNAAAPLRIGGKGNAAAIADALETVHTLAHKLAGSAATYGYEAIGITARHLELLSDRFMKNEGRIRGSDREKIDNTLNNLDALIQRIFRTTPKTGI